MLCSHIAGGFNLLDVCWEQHSGPQTVQETPGVEDNFLDQVLHKANKGETLQDLVLTNTAELIKEVKIESSLGCSDRAMV